MRKFRVIFNDPQVESITVTASVWEDDVEHTGYTCFYAQETEIPVVGITTKSICYIMDEGEVDGRS